MTAGWGCRVAFQAHGRPAPEDARGKQHFLNFRYRYDGHNQLRAHLQLFLDAYNHARRLKPGFPRWIDVLPVPCAEFGNLLGMLARHGRPHHTGRDG